MNDHDKSVVSSYLMYLDANDLYGWTMIQTLPVNGFKWVEKLSKFNEKFIKNYNENIDRECFLEVDVEYPKSLFNFHKDLPYLPGIKKLWKVKKVVCGIGYKEKYVHICSHKSFKTTTKLWFNAKKSTQSNSV